MALESSAYDFSELEEISNPYLYLEIPASKDSIGEIKISTRKVIAKEISQIEYDARIEEIKLLTLKKTAIEIFEKDKENWLIYEFLENSEKCKLLIEFEIVLEKYLKKLGEMYKDYGDYLKKQQEIMKARMNRFLNIKKLIDYCFIDKHKNETLAEFDGESVQDAAQRLANALIKVSKTAIGTPEPKITNAALQVVKPPKPEVAIDKIEKSLATKAAPETKTSPLLKAGDSINPREIMSDKEYMLLLDITLFFESKPLLDNVKILGIASDLIEIEEKLSKQFMKELKLFLKLGKEQTLSWKDIKEFKISIKEEMQLQKNKIIHAEYL